MVVFGICQFFGRHFDNGRIQFLIENTTVTVFTQKFDYAMSVIFEKIIGDTVI